MKLFDNLMALCNQVDQSKFFYRDTTTLMGTTARIFSYNYASYSDWLLPDALECRGIMFEIDSEGKPVRVMARPMEKFFNLNETPFTMNLDLSKIELAMYKADGSLVSTYVDQGRLFFKSKASVSSSQAIEAGQILDDIAHEKLRARLIEIADLGYTANFEYVSPMNRIVLSYQKRELILLNVRHNRTGEYISYRDLYADAVLRPYLVANAQIDYSNEDWVSQVRGMVDIEGFVFKTPELFFKLKTDWYVALHRTKDSITKNDSLFESVVAGGTDDLRSLFETDDWALTKIQTFERVYLDYLSKAINLMNSVYEKVRGKDRKVFATTAQMEFKSAGYPWLFGVLMGYYSSGLQLDTLTDKLGDSFMRNYKQFVPKEYEIEAPPKVE